MSHNSCNVGIVFDLRQNALADDRMLLHLATLLQRECSGLLQKSWGETNFANIVNEAAEVH